MPRAKITISAMLPKGVSQDEIAGFVFDALETHGGSRRPPGAYGEYDQGDPLFHSLRKNHLREIIHFNPPKGD